MRQCLARLGGLGGRIRQPSLQELRGGKKSAKRRLRSCFVMMKFSDVKDATIGRLRLMFLRAKPRCRNSEFLLSGQPPPTKQHFDGGASRRVYHLSNVDLCLFLNPLIFFLCLYLIIAK